MSILSKIPQAYKAFAGAVVAVAAYVVAANVDGSIDFGEWSEIGKLVVAGVVGFVAVFVPPNKPPVPLPPPQPPAE